MERFKGSGASGNGCKGRKLVITRHSLRPDALRMLHRGTQGRLSDGDHVTCPPTILIDPVEFGDQERPNIQ
jgi:hypothetical protein